MSRREQQDSNRRGRARRNDESGSSGSHTGRRVLGAFVLLLLAGAILPLIFDGQGAYQEPLVSRMEAPPPMPEVPRSNAQRPVVIADTDAIEIPQPAVESTEAESTAETDEPAEDIREYEPRLDSKGLPESWSVRLAAFSNPVNARNAVEQLLRDGHRAYMREQNSERGRLNLVFVGPRVDRAAAEELKVRLEQETEYENLMVVRYQVEEL